MSRRAGMFGSRAGAGAGVDASIEADALVDNPGWDQLQPSILIMLAALWQDLEMSIPVSDVKKGAFFDFVRTKGDSITASYAGHQQYRNMACGAIERLRGGGVLPGFRIDCWLERCAGVVIGAGHTPAFIENLFGIREKSAYECSSSLDAQQRNYLARALSDRQSEALIAKLLPNIRVEMRFRHDLQGCTVGHIARVRGYSEDMVAQLTMSRPVVSARFDSDVKKPDPDLSRQLIKLLVIHELIDAELIQNASFTERYRQEVHQLKTLLVESDDGLSTLSKAELFVLEKLLQGVWAFDASIKERIYTQLWRLSIGFDPRPGTETLKAVNGLGYWGTELHLALGEGLSPGYIIWLIDCCGADIAVINGFNETPLMIAVGNGYHGEVLKKLIKPDQVNHQDVIHWETAVHRAAWSGNEKALELLLKAGGIDINIANYSGTTALHAAAIVGSKECAKLLLDNGADVNELNGQYQSALCLAVSAPSRSCALVEFLLSSGAKVCLGAGVCSNALALCVSRHRAAPRHIFKTLLASMPVEKLNAQVDYEFAGCESVLETAVSLALGIDVIDALLEAGAEVTPSVLNSLQFDALKRDPTSESGYNIEVRRMIKRFITAGADPHKIINEEGESLCDLVSKKVRADGPLLLLMDAQPALGNFG